MLFVTDGGTDDGKQWSHEAVFLRVHQEQLHGDIILLTYYYEELTMLFGTNRGVDYGLHGSHLVKLC